MKQIDRSVISYFFSETAQPRLSVKPGEQVVFETYDCFTNRFLPEGTTYENVPPCPANPLTGPLYVEGALPGDLLKITIDEIETGPVGIVVVGPKSGCMREHFPERQIRRIPVENGYALFSQEIRLPVRPMIGTIGVAPSQGEIPALTPSGHGGNMDCTKIGEGTSLYLPVFVDGGLLSMGDVHALMGDGEVEDCGLEIEARVTVTVDVVRGAGIDYPLLETPDEWITLASAETAELAWQAADREMFHFLTTQAGIDAYEAGMLTTLAGNLAFCQIVNPMLTMRMEFPKAILEQYGFRGLRNGTTR